MKNLEIYFPGWTRKALSFTIDDGNIALDRKFLAIVKPAGILGTFNLVSNNTNTRRLSDEELRSFYKGYEVANHCKFHPFALDPEIAYEVVEADSEILPSDNRIHKTELPGLYEMHYRNGKKYPCKIADAQAYVRLVDEGKSELEAIFGEGSITAFVWPYGEQKDERILDYLKKAGYTSVRKTGCVGFDLPRDRMRWSYCANHANLTGRAEEFEALPDDGELKWFCFGVHSHDFENNDCWNVLEDFAARYGNRPEDFWYSTVRGVFEYEDAAKALVVSDSEVFNPSDITVYVKINGKRATLMPGTHLSI